MKYKKSKVLALLIIVVFLIIVLIAYKSKSKVNNQKNTADNTSAVSANTTSSTPGSQVEGSSVAVDASSPSWTFDRYQSLMTESGRNPGIDQNIFDEIQKRKSIANDIVDTYLKQKFGTADPAVEKAFNEVPREYFQYQYQENRSFADVTYENPASKVKPWPIGWGSALSDYLGQMYMTQIAKPKPDDVVLEIGTGSGYQSAILSRIVKQVYTIEIIKPLGQAVDQIYKPLGYNNIQARVGDGFYGWPEVKGGFDIIIVTAAAKYVPPALIDQLKPNGTMVIPVGQPFKRGQVLYIYTKDKDGRVHSKKDVGVYFIPMTGAILNPNTK
ncbi:MAG: protein-L-isoaspartate O-methyltransferase [Patescibacteria group bacterium]|nr:protein-L-isoaspartate O-methyltransferase [Patescibacteria group bacterium]